MADKVVGLCDPLVGWEARPGRSVWHWFILDNLIGGWDDFVFYQSSGPLPM
jgi:hypothetical protein